MTEKPSKDAFNKQLLSKFICGEKTDAEELWLL